MGRGGGRGGGGRVRVNPRDFDSYRESKSSTPAASSASPAAGSSGYGPRHTQDRTADVHVTVQGRESHDHGVPTTDFIIADRDGSGHQHVVIDDQGNEIHNARVDGR
jgi:hypothetical protein